MNIPRLKLVRSLKLFGLFFVILLIIVVIIYHAMPFVFQFTIQNSVEKFGFGKFSGSVRNVTLTGIDISSVSLGDPDKPYLSVGSVVANYLPWSFLVQKRSGSLILNGVEINCNYDDKGIVFPGLDISKVIKEAQASMSAGRPLVSKIEVRNAICNFNYYGKLLSIPLKMKFFPNKTLTDGYAELELSLRGQVFKINLNVNEESTSGTVSLKHFYPERFYDFFENSDRTSGVLLSDVYASFDVTNKGITGSAKANIQIPFILDSDNKMCKSIPLVLKYSTTFSGAWECVCESLLNSIVIKSDSISSTFKSPKLSIIASGLEKTGTANLALTMESGSAQPHSRKISLKDINIGIKTQFNANELSGEALVNIASIESPDIQAVIKSFSATLPFKLHPDSQPIKKGYFSASDIYVKNINIGAVSGELQQSKDSLSFSAIAPNVILPGMITKINGNLVFNKDDTINADISLHVPNYKTTAPIKLSKWVQTAEGITWHGGHEITGSFQMSPTGISSNLKLKIEDTALEVKRKNHNIASASGITLDLNIQDIFNIRSEPSQVFKISKLNFGTVTIEDLVILFHIEDMNSILLEDISAKWCDGTITVQAIRLNTYMKSYSPTIFCDRVSFSKILEQLNIGKAEGEGTLNGTIPLTFRNGMVTFENGFLYSAPGSNGKIKIESGAIDSITEGIPKDSPQLTQLFLSQMALRDFDYEWVKLYLNSQGENLIAKIQINGKPAKPLPFVYKKEFGSLVSIEANCPGSVFQGLNLDINIKLPFNQLMWYNKELRNLIQKVQ